MKSPLLNPNEDTKNIEAKPGLELKKETEIWRHHEKNLFNDKSKKGWELARDWRKRKSTWIT